MNFQFGFIPWVLNRIDPKWVESVKTGMKCNSCYIFIQEVLFVYTLFILVIYSTIRKVQLVSIGSYADSGLHDGYY